MKDEKHGARSYKGEVIGDSMAITINFKWLLQIVALVFIATYAFWKIESRIQDLERKMVLAMNEIELHEAERVVSQQQKVAEMEERMLWYESELNLNPFSWGKRKKK